MSRRELKPLPDLLEKHPDVHVAIGWEAWPDGRKSGFWFFQVAVLDCDGFPLIWIYGAEHEDAIFADSALGLTEALSKAAEFAVIENDLGRILLDDRQRGVGSMTA